MKIRLIKKNALFELGFRPFFLGSAIVAAFSIIGWSILYSGSFSGIHLEHSLNEGLNESLNYYSPIIWHSHEMIFGYTSAVIAGFLLTAVTNWTGEMTITRWPLALLFLLWLSARIVPFISINNISMGSINIEQANWIIAATNIIFYPLLAITVAIPIIKTNNKRNLFIVVILILLGLSNLFFHLDLLGIVSNTLQTAQYSGLYISLLLIVIFSGRVFPFFIEKGLERLLEKSLGNSPKKHLKETFKLKKYQWLEISCVVSFFLFAIADIINMSAIVFLIISIVTCALHSLRLAGWYNHQIWKVPLLWVLQLGYLFLILGVILKGIGAYYPSFIFPALHSLTLGALGLITLGMMARVSLGHTGRNIHQPPKSVSLIFGLIVLATLIRVFLPILSSAHYLQAIQISAVLWSVGFLLFAIVYFSYWMKPRIDGLPG